MDILTYVDIMTGEKLSSFIGQFVYPVSRRREVVKWGMGESLILPAISFTRLHDYVV